MIATLGPEGSNHHRIAMAVMGRAEDAVLLCADFDAALAAVQDEAASEILICAAHPACAHVVGHGQFALGLTLAETFIAASAPLAILTRAIVVRPRSIALHPATESYTDLTDWEQLVHVASTIAAAEGLREGRWDSALTQRAFASDTFPITREIGAPRDAWLVLQR